METLNRKKEAMIEHHLKRRGIRDQRVLRAMWEVLREEFVGSDLVELAYGDMPLPIEEE